VTTLTNYITYDQVVLIKKTWKLFRGIGPAVVGDTFYSKLFALHPPLRRMFRGDMEEQYRRLMDMLNTIIGNLDKRDVLDQSIISITIRNTNSGMRPVHYKLAEEALLWTLKQGLGNDWTPVISDAWTKGCNLITAAMITLVSPVTK
jgi:hemoglobin-like flavoprotein